MLLAAATGRSAGEEKCVGTSVIPGVDEWERPFTLASLRDACGQDNTPFRALLSPTSVAGNYHARGERHSVGSRPEKVCVMEVMEGSDLAVPPSLQPSRCVWCLHSCKQACDSFEEFWCTHWDGPRGGVGAGAVAWREVGVGRGRRTSRGRCAVEAFQKRQECGFNRFIFGSSGFNKECCFD